MKHWHSILLLALVELQVGISAQNTTTSSLDGECAQVLWHRSTHSS